MTRYKLLDVFGGAEIDGERQPNSNFVYWTDAPTEQRAIPLWMLTEVKPPIPDEPEPGPWLIGDVLCMRTSPKPGMCWVYRTEDGMFCEDIFEAIWQRAGGPGIAVRRLVPELSPRCARCGVTGVALPHGPVGMKVCDACNTAVDAEVTVTRGGSWKHTDRSGDHVTIGRDFDSAYLLAFEGSSRTCIRLDSHEARMGAIAAIHAADDAIGGEE